MPPLTCFDLRPKPTYFYLWLTVARREPPLVAHLVIMTEKRERAWPWLPPHVPIGVRLRSNRNTKSTYPQGEEWKSRQRGHAADTGTGASTRTPSPPASTAAAMALTRRAGPANTTYSVLRRCETVPTLAPVGLWMPMRAPT